MRNPEVEPRDWPERSWALAVAGAVIGLLIHELSQGGRSQEAWHTALMAALMVGGIATAFVVERARVVPGLVFATCAALIIGYAVYHNSKPVDVDSQAGWRVACAMFSIAIATPFFQAWGDAGMPGRPRLAHLAYSDLHSRSWMNIVLWFACWLFTGIVWLLIFVIGVLFDLIGIDAVMTLMQKNWFNLMLIGAAFGAAAGLIRDREQIIITMQSVVLRVFAVLAPVLGIALVLFLVSIAFTGLTPLWEATKLTTPILVTVAIVAIILANATIGHSADDAAKAPLVRYGAMALGATLLPLGIIAAISIGLRIDQHGLTPDRLWAFVFIAVSCVYAIAYLATLLRRRAQWVESIRPANVRLGLGLSALTFVLVLPIIDFGAWSTANQLARLEAGRVSVEKFDWEALRFEFGPSGRKAVEQLAKSGKTPEVKAAAAPVLKANNRWEVNRQVQDDTRIEQFEKRVKILPVTARIPEALKKAITNETDCGVTAGNCIILYNAAANEAVSMHKICADKNCRIFTSLYILRDGVWRNTDRYDDKTTEQRAKAEELALKAFEEEGAVSIREVKRRQVFVEDVPVGDIFE
jgi:Domain of unknown function (DUF4153)